MNLLIQKKSNGVTQKTWKVTPKGHLYIVGGSKKADLYLPQSPDKVWLGLENRDQDWYLLNLAATENFIEHKIVNSFTLKADDFELQISPLNPSQVWQEQAAADAESVLVIKKLGSSVVDSKSYTLKEFAANYAGCATPSPQWQKISNTDWIYKLSKNLSLESQPLEKNQWQFTKSDRFMLFMTILIFISGLLSYLLLPNHQSMEVSLNQALPPKIIRETKLKSKAPKVAQESQSGSNFVVTNPKKTPLLTQSNSRLASLVSRISKQNQKANQPSLKPTGQPTAATKTVGTQIITGNSGKIGPTAGLLPGASPNGADIGTLSQGAGGSAAKGNLNRAAGVGGKVGMDILDAEADIEGGLDPEVIAQFIRARLGEILYCYERQLSINPGLYGKVTTQFLIGSNGQVESAKITQTSLKNAGVEGCVTQRIQRWKFPTPKGGSQVNVTYPFLFKNAQ